MNKQELIDHIATQGAASGVPRITISRVLEGLSGAVSHALLTDGGEVTLPGLGKLVAKTRAARAMQNPLTGEEITVPAKRAPAFRPAKALKDAMNA